MIYYVYFTKNQKVNHYRFSDLQSARVCFETFKNCWLNGKMSLEFLSLAKSESYCEFLEVISL